MFVPCVPPPPYVRYTDPFTSPFLTPMFLVRAHWAVRYNDKRQMAGLAYIAGITRTQLRQVVAKLPAPDLLPLLKREYRKIEDDPRPLPWDKPHNSGGGGNSGGGVDGEPERHHWLDDTREDDWVNMDPAARIVGGCWWKNEDGSPTDPRDIVDWEDLRQSGPADLNQQFMHGAVEHMRVVATDQAEHQHEAELINLADLPARSLSWLWKGRIPLGKVTALVGPTDAGKSLIALDLAARVTRGDTWPVTEDDPWLRPARMEQPSTPIVMDGTVPISARRNGDCPASLSPSANSTSTLPGANGTVPHWPSQNGDSPGGVILLCGHDDLSDTVLPRLSAAGADIARITAINMVNQPSYTAPGTVPISARGNGDCPASPPHRFTLAHDLPALEDAITRTPNCKLVVIDPLGAYLKGKKTEQVEVMTKLGELAAKHQVAVLVVSQGRGSSGGGIPARVLLDMAPTAWSLRLDPADPNGRRRMCLPLKNNLAQRPPGLTYVIAPSGIDPAMHATGGKKGSDPLSPPASPSGSAGASPSRLLSPDIPLILWDPEPVHFAADDPRAPEDGRLGRKPTELCEAIAWLREALSHRADEGKCLLEMAERQGVKPRTLRRAGDFIGIVHYQPATNGEWWWRLPHVPEAPVTFVWPPEAQPKWMQEGRTGPDAPREGEALIEPEPPSRRPAQPRATPAPGAPAPGVGATGGLPASAQPTPVSPWPDVQNARTDAVRDADRANETPAPVVEGKFIDGPNGPVWNGGPLPTSIGHDDKNWRD